MGKTSFRYRYIREAETLILAGYTSHVEIGEYFGVSASTIKSWCKKHPDFDNACRAATASLCMAATKNIVDAIDSGDIETSKWLLSRRSPAFQPVQKLEHSTNGEQFSEMLENHRLTHNQILDRLNVD